MRDLIDKLFFKETDNSFYQFIRYFFVGGIAAVVNILCLFINVDILKINYLFSNIIAFILGLIVNYLLSKKFVFKNNNSMNKAFEFIMYSVIGVLGLGFDTFMLWIFTSKLKIYY